MVRMRKYTDGFLLTIVLVLVLLGPNQLADDIPTDIQTWNRCCHHEDCRQGRVRIVDTQGDLRYIIFKDYPEFMVDKSIILPTQNGKEYVCWLEDASDDDGETYERPTFDNTICVFKLYNMAKK